MNCLQRSFLDEFDWNVCVYVNMNGFPFFSEILPRRAKNDCFCLKIPTSTIYQKQLCAVTKVRVRVELSFFHAVKGKDFSPWRLCPHHQSYQCFLVN